MDNQNRKRKEYPDHKKIITGLAITVVLTLVDVYLSVMTADFNLAHLFAFIENEHLRIAVLALFQMALLGSSYGIVYFAISLVYKFFWKIKNSRLYLRGAWLHIHDKEDAKIGVVDIGQDFYDLTVTATNIKPRSNAPSEKQTTWYYIATAFSPNGSIEDKLVGCYLAHRKGERNKYGVHLFTSSSGSPYPTALEGNFGDIFKAEDKNVTNGRDRTGKLYLFRMPKCIKKYIKYVDADSFDDLRLSNILDTKNLPEPRVTLLDRLLGRKPERIEDTEFCKKLREVLEKNECHKQYRTVREHLAADPSSGLCEEALEDCIAKILCKAILCDEDIAMQERENLNYILGTHWDDHYIHRIFRSLSYPGSDEQCLDELIDSLKAKDYTLWDELRVLVLKATKCVIHSDGIVNTEEAECRRMIAELFR